MKTNVNELFCLSSEGLPHILQIKYKSSFLLAWRCRISGEKIEFDPCAKHLFARIVMTKIIWLSFVIRN